MRLVLAFFVLACSLSGLCLAEEAEIFFPAKGNWEFGLVGGGGKAFTNTFRGMSNSADLIFAGGRIGWIVASGKGWNMEYAAEAIPAFLILQDTDAYAAEMTPFLLRWSFAGNHKVSPDIELGAGMLVSSADVPPGTSKFNFTPQSSVGLSIWTRSHQAFRFGLKYIHISNAGLGRHNPGFNTLNVIVSYHWYH